MTAMTCAGRLQGLDNGGNRGEMADLAILSKTAFSAKIIDCKSDEDFPVNAIGTIRLWVDGKPTEKRIFITSDAPKTTELITSKDDFLFNAKVDEVLKRAKVSISDYGKGRSFHMDIHVPEEVADVYTR